MNIHSTVHLKLRELQDCWLSVRADEIQGYDGKNDMKNFYSSLKEVYSPTSASSSPLFSTDGTKILERWAEHFIDALNRPSSINNKATEHLP